MMRLRILMPAIALVAAMAVGTVVVFAQSGGFAGNPGGNASFHPDYSSADAAANDIVHVACGVGKHEGHWHLLTYYWVEWTADGEVIRDVKCGLPASGEQQFANGGEYSTGDNKVVEYSIGNRSFSTASSTTTARGAFVHNRVAYCNGLFDADDNRGMYPTFEDVPDACERLFFWARAENQRPSDGGV